MRIGQANGFSTINQNLGTHDARAGLAAGNVRPAAQAGGNHLSPQQTQMLSQILLQFIKALLPQLGQSGQNPAFRQQLGQGQGLGAASSSKGWPSAANQAFGKGASDANQAFKSSSTSSSEKTSSSSKPSPSKPKPSSQPMSRPKPPVRRTAKPKKKTPVKKPTRGVKPDSRSPLALDINGVKGIQTSEQKIRFDIDGDGKLDRVNDVQEGVLGFGRGRNGKELFGDNTDLNGDGKADGYKNGFEALRALAKQEGLYNEQAGDTKLDARDIEFLEQKYNFGMKQGYQGELESLSKHGVSEIELGSENAKTSFHQGDQKDVQIQRQEGATFKHHGETKEYVDVWHQV